MTGQHRFPRPVIVVAVAVLAMIAVAYLIHHSSSAKQPDTAEAGVAATLSELDALLTDLEAPERKAP